MTGVLVWLSLRCTQGIIEVFKIDMSKSVSLENGGTGGVVKLGSVLMAYTEPSAFLYDLLR